MSHRYYQCCVNWPRDDVDEPGGLCDMIHNAKDIGRQSFLRRVEREDMERLEEQLGYVRRAYQGLTMARDPHVSYHRSTLHGRDVFFFRHSAVEYVFTPDGHP